MDLSQISPDAWAAIAKGGSGVSVILAIAGLRLYGVVTNLLQRVAVLEALQGVKPNVPKA